MHACFKLILFVFSSFILNKRVTYTKRGYLKLTLHELLCLIIREYHNSHVKNNKVTSSSMQNPRVLFQKVRHVLISKGIPPTLTFPGKSFFSLCILLIPHLRHEQPVKSTVLYMHPHAKYDVTTSFEHFNVVHIQMVARKHWHGEDTIAKPLEQCGWNP
jgi:hypothetical protein